jgi:hypothetical protein
MKLFASALALATAVLVPVAAAPALAQEPVDVETHVTFDPVTRGAFQDVDCAIENLSGERLVVLISPSVTYADGQVQRFHLNQPPTILGPDETFILSIGFAVPADAGPGTATFTCAVRVVGPVGSGFVDSSSSTFEVVGGGTPRTPGVCTRQARVER